MIKFILLSSFCLNLLNGSTKCGQYVRFDLSDASECRSLAKSIGLTQKHKIEELGGSMASYHISCLAVDNQGLDIDQTFEISYNIL